jgi:protein-arginine kinase activator protein McsA
VNELRDRLRRAIQSEQFELAADIRDKLRGLE